MKQNFLNPNLDKLLKNIQPVEYDIDFLFEGIVNQDIKILSKAITLIESQKKEDQEKAAKLIEKLLPYTGKSYRIGITGIPGVGKSTFINAFGKYLLQKNHKIAVLTIDPSSRISKGSILGDKNRMPDLSGHKNAFVRSSPNSGFLGGVNAKTRETILLCEAAGFDIIIVETVGVGQSEIAIADMTDIFVLLMVAGTGDELQGIKRGIMEMADIIVFTKDDADNKLKTKLAVKQFQNALNLFPPKPSQWKPKVISVSALNNWGIDKAWQVIEEYFSFVKKNNFFVENRQQQRIKWFNETIEFVLKNFLNEKIKDQLQKYEQLIKENKIYPFYAASEIIKNILKI